MSLVPHVPTTRQAVDSRTLGVDAVRYASVCAVVLIHMLSRRSADFAIDTGDVVNQLCRFAVPFFFVSGGYFLGLRGHIGLVSEAKRVVSRIAPVFFFWLAIYVLVFPSMILHPLTLKSVAILFATGGGAYHLWFLPTYVLCVLITTALARYATIGVGTAAATWLYCAGLLCGSYAGLVNEASPASAMGLSIARGGPFFGTIFMWSGLIFARTGFRSTLTWGCLLFASGSLICLAEADLLNALHLSRFRDNDFLFGTVASGTGAFLIALNLPYHRTVQLAARFGRLSLGIYAVHLLPVLWMLARYTTVSIVDKIMLSVGVVILSSLIASGLAWSGVTRRFVS